MKNTAQMSPEELREKARQVAFEFADEVISIFERAFLDLSESLSSKKRPAAVSAPSAPRAAKAAPAKAAKRAAKKAPTGGDPQLKTRIHNALRKTKTGMSAEQINRMLGTTSRDLAVPMQELINENRVTKSGQARGTKYFAR